MYFKLSCINNTTFLEILTTSWNYMSPPPPPAGSTWQKLTDLPLSVTVPTYTLSDDVRPLSWYTDVSGTPQNIIISRITLSPQVTMHLYITGSHILHRYEQVFYSNMLSNFVGVRCCFHL